MRIYTVLSSKVVAGVKETQHERLGRVLALGERGRGRWETLVAIHRDLPEGFTTCYPLMRQKEVAGRQMSFVLLVPERQPSSDILLHIRTAGPYTRHTKGSVRLMSGEATLLARGWGAHGAAGRLGTWDDDLWMATPNTVFELEYFGGHKVPLYAVVVDENSVPSVMLWDEYETMRAIQQMEKESNQ